MVVVAKQPNPGVVFPLILATMCIGVGIVFQILEPGAPFWFEVVFCGIWYLGGAFLICVAVKSRKPSGPAVIFDSTGIIWHIDTGFFSRPRVASWQWDDFTDARAVDWRDSEGHQHAGIILQLKPNVPNVHGPWSAKLNSKVLKAMSGDADLGDNLVYMAYSEWHPSLEEVAQLFNESVNDPEMRKRWGEPARPTDDSRPTI